GLGLRLAPGKAKELEDLEPVFQTIPVVSQHRVNKIKFGEIDVIIQGIGKKRRDRPNAGGLLLLMVKKRADGFGAVTWRQRQTKLLKSRTQGEVSGMRPQGQEEDDESQTPAVWGAKVLQGCSGGAFSRSRVHSIKLAPITG